MLFAGIENLISDPELEGGGIHVSKKNGYLKVHSDFESHIINETWERKINILIYFNKGFGNLSVSGFTRLPKPAASIIAFLIMLFKNIY